jgi:hypothetical protein
LQQQQQDEPEPGTSLPPVSALLTFKKGRSSLIEYRCHLCHPVLDRQ